MDNKKTLWNANQKVLKEVLTKPDRFDEAIKLCLEQHAMVHSAEMSQTEEATFEDELWEGLEEDIFKTAVNEKGRTVAYGVWHSTRIEDITMNILVSGGEQVINSEEWMKRIGSNICDTGNALTTEEIMEFSRNISMQELRNYRIAVGRKTKEIILSFKPADIKRKMKPERLQRVLDEGAVRNVETANWLIDFWGRKNVAGILLMPVTRHHVVHISESMNAKKKGQALQKR
ncbi:MAG: DinB family protein [Bacillota bacterium]|nr:DinB family protein [Bacillota bacterium]